MLFHFFLSFILFLYFLEESVSLFAAGDDMGGISLWRIYPKGPGTLGPKPEKNKNNNNKNENKIDRENENSNKIENENKNGNKNEIKNKIEIENNNNNEEEFIANVQETVRLQCFLNLNLLIRGNEKNEKNNLGSTTSDNIKR